MSGAKENRIKLVQVRLTASELKQLHQKFSESTSQKLSDYARKKLLDKPVKIFYRNQSLDAFMEEMIMLRTELNAIANNYNQVVKRLHSMYDYTELPAWLLTNDSSQRLLLKKIDEIKTKINQINDEWLR